MLDERTFWRIISQFDWTKTGDDDEVMAPARATLSAMPVADIAAFDELLAQKLYALDTREHCRQPYLGEVERSPQAHQSSPNCAMLPSN